VSENSAVFCREILCQHAGWARAGRLKTSVQEVRVGVQDEDIKHKWNSEQVFVWQQTKKTGSGGGIRVRQGEKEPSACVEEECVD